MNLTQSTLPDYLLESAAGRSVYDNLIQANVDPRKVSLDIVKDMLLAECRHRQTLDAYLVPA